MNDNKIKYSVIIPTLNEEKYLSKLLKDLDLERNKYKEYVEIIISDGNSTDNTIEICSEHNVNIINSEKGRGTQLRNGAKIARGDVLVFFHSDISIPINLFDFLDKHFNDKIKIATFRMKLDVNNLLYKIYSFFTRFDSVFTTFGDQGLIVTNDFYNKIGGIKNLPLMEDVDFLKRARSFTSIVKFKKDLIVSTRRFTKIGIIKTQFKSFVSIVKYLLGVDINKIYKYYYSNKDEKKKSSNNFRKIAGKRKSKNQVSFNNKC